MTTRALIISFAALVCIWLRLQKLIVHIHSIHIHLGMDEVLLSSVRAG